MDVGRFFQALLADFLLPPRRKRPCLKKLEERVSARFAKLFSD